jgi:beta-lactamase regulating signal transducer with metallopeptidase domain
VIAWAIEALIASALLMIAVLVVRTPVRRAFGARAAYALWALPALRMVLPPLPAWPADATPVTLGRETIMVLVTAQPAASAPAWPTMAILAALWGAGAVAFLTWHIVRHARFCRVVVRHGGMVDTVDGIRVIESDAAPGPIAFGLFRRHVAIPGALSARYDADERALALAHEFAHHRGGDLFANWAALVVLALHWPNPFAWRAFRAFRADQELACDARVIAERGPVAAHAYARAILKAAHPGPDWSGAVSAACHLHTIADLKGRLKMLHPSPASRRRLAAGGTMVSLLVVGGLVITASGTGATAAMTGGLAATAALVGQVAPPVPPTPPAPVAGAGAVKRVIIVKDGRTTTYEGAQADAYIAEHPAPAPPVPPVPPVAAVRVPAVPRVVSMECPGADARDIVRQDRAGGDQRIVICSNRIREIAAQGAAQGVAIAANAKTIERDALVAAVSGLRAARAGLLEGKGMADRGNRDAMPAIEEALAEVEADLAALD